MRRYEGKSLITHPKLRQRTTFESTFDCRRIGVMRAFGRIVNAIYNAPMSIHALYKDKAARARGPDLASVRLSLIVGREALT